MAGRLETQEVRDNMDKLQSKFQAAVELLCANGAQKMENYAKENRPWHDRTGDARRRLNGSWDKVGEVYRVSISHGVSYGVYLEFKNERRYAILKPTVEKVGYGEVLPAFENLLDKTIGRL